MHGALLLPAAVCAALHAPILCTILSSGRASSDEERWQFRASATASQSSARESVTGLNAFFLYRLRQTESLQPIYDNQYASVPYSGASQILTQHAPYQHASQFRSGAAGGNVYDELPQDFLEGVR